jgi:hypothetical protein
MIVIAVVVAAAAPGARAQGELPAWLHEGACLTFTWDAAVAPGNGSDYRPDEHGDWVNSATGEHYSRSTQHGTSGSGWSQAVIASIDGDKAVVGVQSFGDAGALGRNVPVPLQGGSSFVTPIDQGGDYWISPAKLAALHTDANAGTLVELVRWQAADRIVPAIRVQIISHGSYSLHIFDAKSGLCLHYATAVRGAAPKLVGPGDMGQRDVTLTHGDLVGQRDLAIPWARDVMPAWLPKLKALHYAGSIVSRGVLPTVPNDVKLDLLVTDRGQNWVQLDSTSSMAMQGAPAIPPSTSTLAFGRAQFAGLWAGPASLATLHRGQELDNDPITRMKTVVARIDDHSLVISQHNDAGEITSEYDKATGMLTASSFVNCLSQQQLTVKLQSRE